MIYVILGDIVLNLIYIMVKSNLILKIKHLIETIEGNTITRYNLQDNNYRRKQHNCQLGLNCSMQV